MDLPFLPGAPKNLTSFAAGGALVIYFYPGIEWRAYEPKTSKMDAAQARGFDDCEFDLKALRYPVVGISTQPIDMLRTWAAREEVRHALASDSDLQVAHALKLPTERFGNVPVYERVTLIVSEGRISKAFRPNKSPEQAAGQVLAWLYREPSRR